MGLTRCSGPEGRAARALGGSCSRAAVPPLAALLLLSGTAAFAQAPAPATGGEPARTPSATQADSEQDSPGVPQGAPRGAPGDEPQRAEPQPAGPQPVGPVRTFEPVPIPEGMAPPGVRTTPLEPGAEPPPAPVGPPPVDLRQGGRVAPTVPGAAEAGLVVADPRRVLGADALPAVGEAVAAASGLRLSAVLRARYLDNFGLLPDRDVVDDPSEVLLEPSIVAAIGRRVGRQLFYLDTSLGRSEAIKNRDRSANQIALNGGMAWRLGRQCDGRVAGAWTTGRVLSTDLLVRRDQTNRTTTLLLSGACRLDSGLLASASHTRGRQRFELARGVDFGSNFWAAGGSLGYALGRRGQVGVEARYQNAVFPFGSPGVVPVPVVAGNDRTESIGVSGVATYRFTRYLVASAGIGWTRTTSSDPVADDFSGWTGNVSLAYNASRWGASAGFARNVSLGQDPLARFVVDEVFNAAVTYRLTRRVSATGGFDYQHPDRRGIVIGPGAFLSLVDRNWRASVGADVALAQRLDLSVDYGHQTREFDLLPGRAHANTVTGALRFVFR